MENELLRHRFNVIEKILSEIEARDTPITVREAIRTLEACICLEAVGGSKTKFKGRYYNFDAISKASDPAITLELSIIIWT